jgi:hypothetical protein
MDINRDFDFDFDSISDLISIEIHTSP